MFHFYVTIIKTLPEIYISRNYQTDVPRLHFSMYFQVLNNDTLLEVLAGHGMVIEDSDIHLGTVLKVIQGPISALILTM